MVTMLAITENCWKLLTILTTVLMTRLTIILTYCWHNVDDKVDDDVDNNFDYSVDDNVDNNFDDDVDNNVENVDIVLWPCWGNLTHLMITKARWSHHKLLSSWLQRQAWIHPHQNDHNDYKGKHCSTSRESRVSFETEVSKQGSCLALTQLLLIASEVTNE